MKRAASFEAATDEDFILEEIYEDVDFDFDLKEVHSGTLNFAQETHQANQMHPIFFSPSLKGSHERYKI